ncbi:hypothetical protein HKX42_09530 [Salinisphaera sp. USBA-960]|nr:hypothetical protein [Salifodinibacter halophilus]NNC27114.1 hypothetical protein [Salifodinibacter halophilus]
MFAPIVAQLRGQPVELAADAAGAARLANETDPRRQATTTCRATPAGMDHLTDYRANWRRHVMCAST